MGLWVVDVEQQTNEVTLRYTASVLPGRVKWQPCGRAEAVLADALIEWCLVEALPYDVVTTPTGSFLKLDGPRSA